MTDTTYIEDYLAYASCTEAPPNYHHWCALGSLSSIIGPRVFTDMGAFTWSCNIYIILVGDPGDKKTTSMRIARDVVKDSTKVQLGSSSITREALVQMMATTEKGKQLDSPCHAVCKLNDKLFKYSQIAAFSSEFKNFIQSGGAPIPMITFLADIWDCVQTSWRDTTKNKGDYEIEHPYLSIIGCIPTKDLKNLLIDDIITSGMSRRMIFIQGEKPKQPHAFPEPTEAQKAARRRCLLHADSLLGVEGTFTWENDARAIYVDAYDRNFFRSQGNESSITRNFLQTKPEFIVKLSMLYRLAESPTSLIHTADSIRRAIKTIESVELGAYHLFDGTGRNELSAISREVLAYVAKTGFCTLKAVQKAFYEQATLQELDQMIEALVRMGSLKRATHRDQPLVAVPEWAPKQVDKDSGSGSFLDQIVG